MSGLSNKDFKAGAPGRTVLAAEDVEITAEMVAAGVEAYAHLEASLPDFLLVKEIYKAMRQCAPKGGSGETRRVTADPTSARQIRDS